MAGIKGFATEEGTQRFQQRFEGKADVATGHFRTAVDGLVLSSLGMGTYLGQPVPEDDVLMTEAAVTSVLSGAVNVLDTAINYRFQQSERSLKTAIETLLEHGVTRDELFVASKNGFLTPDAHVNEDFRDYFGREFIESGIVDPREIVGGMHCMTPAYLNDQLNRSLANLGLETLDLMYLHNAAESQIPEIGLDAFMKRLKIAFEFYESVRKDGRIRYYGLATWNCFRIKPGEVGYLNLSEVIKLAESVSGPEHGFRFVQFPFNLAMVEALTLNNQPLDAHGSMGSMLDAVQVFGLGAFTSVPLLQGQLLEQQRLPHFDGLETPAQNCLQFTRSTPGILAPLVGHKTPKHVADNLKVAGVPPVPFETLQELMTATAG